MGRSRECIRLAPIAHTRTSLLPFLSSLELVPFATQASSRELGPYRKLTKFIQMEAAQPSPERPKGNELRFPNAA